MQAIRTRYTGPTNTRGSRIHAQCAAGRLSVPYDHAQDIEGNHRAACDALRFKLGWYGPEYAQMIGGDFGGDTYWVFTPKSSRT